MLLHDAHCHFFSRQFLETLAKGLEGGPPSDPASSLTARLGWETPGTAEELADRWMAELDRHGVGRATLIASVPGDEASVAAAVARHPQRFVGFFMVDPTQEDAAGRVHRALSGQGLRTVCLFPAMHRYSVQDDRAMKIFQTAAEHPATAVFVHCGVLTVGVRKKLGLASRFDIRFGNPLDLHAVALAYPRLPIIIPHFGAGLFREALMVADLCPNILLDTSSSNSWTKYHPGLTLADVFRQALEVVGPERLLFGTDSSFFPRGWQAAVRDAQLAALEQLRVPPPALDKIFHENFDRLFPQA